MSSSIPTEDLLDWQSTSETSIDLDSGHIEQSVQLSQTVLNPTAQWQTYLNGLAFFGFEQWLSEWAPEFVIDRSQCSLFQPAYANLIEVVCNLRVNTFRLALIVSSDRISPVIDCAKAAIELPDFAPDFYVLMEVLEEEVQVDVYGYQRRDNLQQSVQSQSFPASSNWFYPLPLNWFNPEPTSLLLELRCLEPTAIARSPIPSPTQIPVPQLQTRLATLTPQLQRFDALPQQLLTWQEGATILSHPELVEELFQIAAEGRRQRAENQDVISPSPSSPFPSINVASWLRDRLDTVAQELSWMLMPAFTPAMAELRSNDPFSPIQSTLAARGIIIPAEARGAFQDQLLAPVTLRLYAVTWALPITNDSPEWTLLLVLGTVSGDFLPSGTSLQVRVAGELLDNQTAEPAVPYLYTQVIGNLNEQFCSEIRLPNGEMIELPPFTFKVDR